MIELLIVVQCPRHSTHSIYVCWMELSLSLITLSVKLAPSSAFPSMWNEVQTLSHWAISVSSTVALCFSVSAPSSSPLMSLCSRGSFFQKISSSNTAAITLLHHSGFCSIVSSLESLSPTIWSKIAPSSFSHLTLLYLWHDTHHCLTDCTVRIYFFIYQSSPLEGLKAGDFSVLVTIVFLAPRISLFSKYSLLPIF